MVLCLLLLSDFAVSSGPAAISPFLLTTDGRTGGLTRLRHAADTQGVEFLRAGQALGAVILRVRTPGAPWREVRESTQGVALSSRIGPQGEALLWEIRVKNTGSEALELGDLALPLPMNTDFVWDHDETFQRRVFRHAFIAQHGSFLYWLPVRGTGPILVMMPEGDTHLEFFTSEGMDYASARIGSPCSFTPKPVQSWNSAAPGASPAPATC